MNLPYVLPDQAWHSGGHQCWSLPLARHSLSPCHWDSGHKICVSFNLLWLKAVLYASYRDLPFRHTELSVLLTESSNALLGECCFISSSHMIHGLLYYWFAIIASSSMFHQGLWLEQPYSGGETLLTIPWDSLDERAGMSSSNAHLSFYLAYRCNLILQNSCNCWRIYSLNNIQLILYYAHCVYFECPVCHHFIRVFHIFLIFLRLLKWKKIRGKLLAAFLSVWKSSLISWNPEWLPASSPVAFKWVLIYKFIHRSPSKLIVFNILSCCMID